MDVVLATSNPGKLREARAILEAAGLTVSAPPMWLGDVESGTTYLENARLKGSSALRLVRAAVLAEDAGLEVDSLHRLPGIRSARFAGPGATAELNNEKLLRLMGGMSVQSRLGRYRAVAVLLLPSGEEFVGEGVLEGRIAETRKGDAGFGYDPLFIPAGDDRTVAEMSDEEKNEISHRARALREIVTRIEGR
jgi:XTP/dITP diphosphohydrolase